MNFFKFMILPVIVMVLYSLSPAYAGSQAIRMTIEEAVFTERGLGDCSGSSQEVIACVQTKLERFGSALENGFIPNWSPKAAPIVKKAARNLKRVKSKAAALSVLNKARSILRGLVVKTKGQTKDIYQRVSITLSKAIKVIQRKS